MTPNHWYFSMRRPAIFTSAYHIVHLNSAIKNTPYGADPRVMCLRVWAAVCLVWALPSWQLEGGLSDEFLVEELPGHNEQNVFRPRTAKEASRLASRIAYKQRSAEDGVKYGLLHGAGIGPKGMRVAVHGVVEVTTPRYYHRPRRFRKVSEWPSSQEQVDRDPSQTQPRWNPHAPQAFTRNPQQHNQERVEKKQDKKKLNFKNRDQEKPWQKRNGKDPRRNFRNLKRQRDKREVDNTYTGGGAFDLPPMSNEWNIQKKKKKRKKKITTTDAPATKKMQKKSKKFRIYMESSEVELGKGKAKGKVMDVVKGLSKELDQLLADVHDQGDEPVTQGTAVPVTKAKYVPIPKNWQNPPSWRPPTRGAMGAQRHQSQWKPIDVDISAVPFYQHALQVTEAVTEFDWRSYKHPLKTAAETDISLVLKPAPSDWPQPTHPADGVYDWHKSQLRRLPRTMRPYPTHSVSSLTDDTYNKQFSGGGHRVSRYYVGYTSAPTTKWSWAKPAEDQRVMYRSNHMWQTRAWIPRMNVQPPSTWPTIGTKAAFLNSPVEESDVGAGESPTQGYSYRFSPQNAPWRGSWQGSRHLGEGSYTQQQRYPNYYNNYTNQYYQQYYGRLSNRTAYPKGSRYLDMHSSGFYQRPSFFQNQAEKQSRIKPPSYYYNAFEEIRSTVSPEDGMSDHRTATLEAPFRQHDEYAGNDRDLRAPLPTSAHSFPLSDRDRWTPARFRLTRLRRKNPVRPRRVVAGRPTGYRSIFTVPLQRTSWNTTLPHRPYMEIGVTPRIL